MSTAPAGLPQNTGGAPEPERARSSAELIDRAARGEASGMDHLDLLAYFLDNGELPADNDPVDVEWSIGTGSGEKKNVWKVKPISWGETQDARKRATDEKTGEFDTYVYASYVVARALVLPALGPLVVRQQEKDGTDAPQDAAELLRRMFLKQSGTLLSLSGDVLRVSQLQDGAGSRILEQEVEAGKR